MAEQRSKWNWEVSGFEPRKWSSSSSTTTAADNDDGYRPGRRYSISAATALAQSELSNQSVASKLQKLQDKVKVWRFWLIEMISGFVVLHFEN